MGKQRGRRPGSQTGRKTAYLHLRLSPAEKKAFEAAARRAGVPLSAWVRDGLLRLAREPADRTGAA